MSAIARATMRIVSAARVPVSSARALPLATPRFFSDVANTEVVTPEVVDTLEWLLDSPPPLHQFDESPIVVEIEH